jgi:hypothetical protein
MGKQVKVEIDDRLPFSTFGNIYPKSEAKDEIWPMLFSKAVCKIL